MVIINGVLITLALVWGFHLIKIEIRHGVEARAARQVTELAEANRRHNDLLTALSQLTDEIGMVSTAAALQSDKMTAVIDEFRERLHRSECEQYDLAVRAQAAAPIRLKMP